MSAAEALPDRPPPLLRPPRPVPHRTPAEVRAIIERATAHLTPTERVRAAELIARRVHAQTRATRYRTPGDLARALDPTTVQTPALELVDRRLVDAGDGRITRLGIFMPPQEGKSTRVVVFGCLWLLLRNPDLRIAIASYEQGLAVRSGKAIRDYIEAFGSGTDRRPVPLADDRLSLSVQDDTSSMAAWSLQGHRGGVISVGIGGAFTGRPADCVSGDVRIITDRGEITAADAYALGVSRLLAYDHTTGRAVWRNVEAARRIPGRRVVDITTTAGRVLTCTPDHRIYTRRGYVPARDLRPGDALVAVMAADRVPLRKHARGAETERAESRPAQTEPLLHARVHGRDLHADQPDPVLQMRGPGATHPPVDMLDRLPGRRTGPPDPALPPVRDPVPAEEFPHHLLLPRVRERRALRTDGRVGQLALQDRHELHPLVPVDAATDPRAGRAPMRRVLGHAGDDLHPGRAHCDPFGAGRAPHRRGRHEQLADQPDHALLGLPRRSPQVEDDAVAVVRHRSGEPVDVYDFQVEGTRNFFGSGLLVHNCLIIDDPVKDARAADSALLRQRAWEWWTHVARVRLAPGGLVIVVQTRWHEDDLSGRLLEQDRTRPAHSREWTWVSIPAQAEPPREDDAKRGRLPDALGRPPGEYLISARGRTAHDWETMRADIGARSWSALYQQHPTPAEGAVFRFVWFDRTRRGPDMDLPPSVVRAVAIDPSAGGSDEAGIVAGFRGIDGRGYLTHDRSGNYTEAQWSRVAWLLAVDTDADRMVWERNLAGPTMKRALTSAWALLQRQARVLARWRRADPFTLTASPEEEAATELARANAGGTEPTPEAVQEIRAQLEELTPERAARILRAPESGPCSLIPVQATTGKRTRATPVATAFETGRAALVGQFTALEAQSTSWLEGQDSPDRMDAMVWLFTDLLAAVPSGSVAPPATTIPTGPITRAR